LIRHWSRLPGGHAATDPALIAASHGYLDLVSGTLG